MKKKWNQHIASRIRDYFISGLLLCIPLFITLLVIKFIMDILDSTLHWLPKNIRPDAFFNISYSNVLISLLIIILTGWIHTRFFLGKQFTNYWDLLINYIPFARNIYKSAQLFFNKVFSPQTDLTHKVFLIEFPLKNMWSIAYQVGKMFPMPSQFENDMICLFILMTPNMTAGFLIIAPRKDAIELNMDLENSIKYVLSLGILEDSKNLSS